MRLEAAQVRDEKLVTAQQQTGGIGQEAGLTAGERGGLEGDEAAMARDRDRRETEAGLRAAGTFSKKEQPLITKAVEQTDLKAKYHVIPR
jgi:hypothetical protein